LPGFSLSARGREQIAATSRELLRRGLEGRCVLVSSPLDRAAESADIVAEALHPQARATDERLRERGSVRDGLARVPSMKALALRLCEPGAVARHERRAFVADRMKQAVSSVLDLARRSGCDTAVVVSHQAPIGILRAALEHGGAESSKPLRTRLPRLWLPWPLLARPSALGSISELELAEDRSVFRGYWSPSSAR
jgi:broad specificity phosphatase PhoE